MMTSAEYGHLAGGTCIAEESPKYRGCSNDVLSLFDKWCSGKQTCKFDTRSSELEELNINCPAYIVKYSRLQHECIQVHSGCRPNKSNKLTERTGYLSSYITRTKGCGSPPLPWIISADPGQTIHLELIDFVQSTQSSSLVSCRSLYGFIVERTLGINQTICGGHDRQLAVYTSKTNSVEVNLVKDDLTDIGEFLIKYTVVGCAEPFPPRRAWYKREGNKAVFGCENNDKEWIITCTGNTWKGEIGNCSQEVTRKIPTITEKKTVSFDSAITMSAIIGTAVVMSVIAVVIGVVYVQKYRMHQETKRAALVHKTYSTMDRNIQAYYRPVTMNQSVDNRTLWDIPLSAHPEGHTMSADDQSEAKDICYGKEADISCPINEVIMMTSADYGHMTGGRCITEESPKYRGCSNDVLPLFDKWCSGKRECRFETPNDELEKLNVNCPAFIMKFLKLHHSCVKVTSTCSSNKPNQLRDKSGYLSSYITNTKTCGSFRSPWIISAKPGQAIHLELIDFSVSSQSSNLIRCRSVYGFILERALGINETICGGRNRRMALYTSKTNSVQVQIAKKKTKSEGEFLIEYKVVGCAELVPPKYAWYKREGNKALIGCEDNDKEWTVTCVENTWKGEIGNCSETVIHRTPVSPQTTSVGLTSVVIMAGIIGSAVVLSVITIVIGVVYVKRYR
ncbi:hypothetical protein LSH36_122g09066 [Paralvinella palmiformis]|uniref:CUB domain-containing protein n=1 Tax=Paralvinella palmiformis TaxID=53620 RepID=A0AAD9JXW3_9ANNE|nr:hypothetical protein LSH36_122g09066 [Paralvinella palmiformis]